MLRNRRRPRYGAQLCAILSAILLLLSVSVLHSRLGYDRRSQNHNHLGFQNPEFSQDSTDEIDALVANPLLEDDGGGLSTTTTTTNHNTDDDRIDELDVIEDETDSVEEEDLADVVSSTSNGRSGYYYDHIVGVTRRAFDKQLATDPWEDYTGFGGAGGGGSSNSEDRSRIAFGSDDEPVDEEVRRKLDGIRGIEDLLLLKTTSPKVSSRMREGWASWFEKKSDFLRRDKMFKSNLEHLNPLNNPLLQDPDGIGLTGLTKGDKIMQKVILSEFQKIKVPSVVKKAIFIRNKIGSGSKKSSGVDGEENGGMVRRNKVKGMERRTLDENTSNIAADANNVVSGSESLKLSSVDNRAKSMEGIDQVVDTSRNEFGSKSGTTSLKSELIYADGRRWGYFPGLYPYLSFSDFMEEFFSKGKCLMRVFMVWNSPPWMYSVRHQRGLESLFYHHPDACVVVFSETIELDFFKDFVKDGFKVAVAMPNLDELLNNTPTQIFASVWFEWKRTKFYPIHYSELVRLAVLYRYGGLYLDSDMLVLKQLSSLNNSVGLEDNTAETSLNGAVMAFEKNSVFLMECLKEFYSTYDDTRLRWNGADLLTRVRNRLLSRGSKSDNLMEVKVEPSSMFFPIGPHHITRYFASPVDDTERAQQDILFRKILDKSYTFHFWNGVTFSVIPEPESLVARLLNQHCIHCLDVL